MHSKLDWVISASSPGVEEIGQDDSSKIVGPFCVERDGVAQVIVIATQWDVRLTVCCTSA